MLDRGKRREVPKAEVAPRRVLVAARTGPGGRGGWCAGEALGTGWSQSWGPVGYPRGQWGRLKDLRVSGRWGEGGPKRSTRTVSSCDLRAGMGQRGLQ